jgi:acetyl esterase/lipase
MRAAAALALALAQPAEGPRYDIRPGDHLVFRQVLERSVRTERGRTAVRAEWETHMLVLLEAQGTLRVGVQRNRTRADLVSGGEARRFAEELSRRPAVVAEGQWLTARGEPLLPLLAVREWPSELLPFVRELEPLPARAVSPGERFKGGLPLGREFRAEAIERVAGEECLRASSAGGPLVLRYWFCGASGTVPRLEFEGRYPLPGAEAHEKLALELLDRRRGEDPRSWLAGPMTREGVLAALLVAQPPPLGPAEVYPLLEGGSPDVQRRVLALAWREGWSPPPLESLSRSLGSEHPRVRTLAARLLADARGSEAAGLRERARADPDPFVLSAVRHRPEPEPALLALARAVRLFETLPEWSCREESDRAPRALAAQRARVQVPGPTLRYMRTAPNEGLPYVVHVPEDYRGDEPYPLLVALGGGPGRALMAAQSAQRAVDGAGYLVVYPQAPDGTWWEEPSIRAVSALLREVLGEFNVDTNRVFLTGFSNGGTGTLLYAALWPDRLAAAAPLMGAGLLLLRDRLPGLAGLARLPLLFVHGDEDAVIMPAGTTDTVKALRRADPSAPLEVHILRGRGHDVWLGADEGLTLPFFERHVRDPFPRRVRLRTRGAEFGRSFWLEVLEKEGGMAEVDGEIEGSTVTLRTRRVRRLRLLLRGELVPPGPLRVLLDGAEAYSGPLEEDCGLLARSWRETGDPFLAHGWERELSPARR